MSLAKTSLLNAVAVIVKLGTAVVLNKVLAVHVGPMGYAVIGQFQSLIAMVSTFASGAINTGVTKYTAEYHDDCQRREAVWRTATMLGLAGSALVALLLVALRAPLARWALGDAALSNVIVWLAGSLVLLVFNGLMLAILNGQKAVRAYVTANIVGSLGTAATATVLVFAYGLHGALIALAVSQAATCLVTAWLCQRACQLRWRRLFGRLDVTMTRALGGFALMGATSAVVVPLTMMLIRDGLADRLGWQAAGYWQALWKVSETHLMLLTTTLSLYFLPRYAEIRRADELRAEVVKGYRFVLPLVLATSSLIYLLREPLVRVLLTAEFLPLAEVMGWQLAGDVLKICSWVVGFTLVSHARTRAFVVTEVVFAAALAGLTLLGAALDGLRGTAIAYALTYLLHGLTMFWLFGQLLRRTASPTGEGAP